MHPSKLRSYRAASYIIAYYLHLIWTFNKMFATFSFQWWNTKNRFWLTFPYIIIFYTCVYGTKLLVLWFLWCTSFTTVTIHKLVKCKDFLKTHEPYGWCWVNRLPVSWTAQRQGWCLWERRRGGGRVSSVLVGCWITQGDCEEHTHTHTQSSQTREG